MNRDDVVRVGDVALRTAEEVFAQVLVRGIDRQYVVDGLRHPDVATILIAKLLERFYSSGIDKISL